MKIDVTHTAKLANLPLKKEDISKLEKQLEDTLTYVDQLEEVKTENIQPTAHVTGLENILREDNAQASLTQKQALSNAKATHEGYITVAKILDTD